MKNALAVFAVLLMSWAALALGVGDKAPPLKVKEWIVGNPVTPDKPDGKTVYVVEFWATWCAPCTVSIPHLNKLHQQYKDKGLVIVGISGESKSKAKPFAEKMKMKYRVAIDNNRATSRTYLKEVRGIPHAFVIGKDGKVVWSGHPMAGLDGVIAQVLAGKYDAGKAKEIIRWQKAFQQAAQKGDLPRALKATTKLIELDPSNYAHVAMQVRLLTFMNDKAAILKTRRDAAKRFAGSAEDLNRLAVDILTSSNLELRDLGLALNCAREAVRLTARKESGILSTFARAYYELCLLDKAIAIQKEAGAAAKDKKSREHASATLKYYDSVKTLREKETAAVQ